MKIKTIFLSMFIGLLVLSCKQSNTVELPLTFKTGYGPFRTGFVGVSPNSEDENNPWRKTYLTVTGIPDDWTEVKKGDIETNIRQTAYQNYLIGNITPEWYEQLQKSWNWIPDTLNLSKQAIKCKIAFAFGKNIAGETKMVVDANNNLDFSDDEIFTPAEIYLSNASVNYDSLAISHAITVNYECLLDNKIVRKSTPVFIAYEKRNKIWLLNFPQYATAMLGENEIAICSGDFANLSYNHSNIILLTDSLKEGKKVARENMLSTDDYLVIKDKTYQYKGVNLNKNVMILEKINQSKNELYSTQIGSKILPFKGQNFITKDTISLDTYKGKYLFIDFWAVWCGPCIQELPDLKILYDNLDKTKIEFVSIVGDSPADRLAKIIEKFGITWTQILSDDTNKIIQTYGINSYPTTLLVNPQGIIIAKDLRGKRLEDKINELIK